MHSSLISKVYPANAEVAAVLPGSPAAAAGIREKDIVLSLGGKPLRDIIDYQFCLEPGVQEVAVRRDGDGLTFLLEYDEKSDPGIRFHHALFDGVRRCRNHCLFCFIDQLPPGLREPLYLKDDDYRLSFLHGNFITLNNLTGDDLERLRRQRLGPLHVSVHATSPVIRAHMMGCSRQTAAEGLQALKTVGSAGIQLHAQIVLCPGINDGQVLKQTVADLAGIPGVASAGVVPVAVAAPDAGSAGPAVRPVPRRAGLKAVEEKICRRVVESVSVWQERFRQERGHGFVYAADEFYLKAGLPLPPAADYDDFPQYENGIGIAATFIAELPQFGESLYLEGLPAGGAYLLSGELAAPLVEFACGKLTRSTGGAFRPLVVKNGIFGQHVTVTGLLGGREIMAAALSSGLGSGDRLLIPAACLESTRKRFLDNVTMEELDESLDCGIKIV